MKYFKTSIKYPLEFISAGNFVSDKSWQHTKRSLDSFEILFGIKKTLYMQQDYTQYQVKEQDMLLLLPGHTHSGYKLSEKDLSFHWILFNCSDYSIIEEKEALKEFSLLKNNPYYSATNPFLLIPIFTKNENIDRLTILLHQLMHIDESNYYTYQAVNFIFSSLMIEITEQSICSYKDSSQNQIQSKKLTSILEWIRINSMKNISLSDVAYEFNYSKEYFSRFFKKHMGMGIQEYITRLKLSKAKHLLCEIDDNIKEIATYIGFNDDKYFMRVFKKYEGITPNEYRNAYCRIHLNNK